MMFLSNYLWAGYYGHLEAALLVTAVIASGCLGWFAAWFPGEASQ